MNLKKPIVSFMITVPLVFLSFAATSFLYSLIVHDNGIADWAGAVRFSLVMGIVFGIVLPRVNRDRT